MGRRTFLYAVMLMALPLSSLQADPPAGSEWVLVPELSDEFDGAGLDKEKWIDHHPKWPGRQPAMFRPENIEVKDGMVGITARADDQIPADLQAAGYHTFSTGFMRTFSCMKYGYFEARTKPMDNSFSSAFWLYGVTLKMSTEIDIHEIVGGGHRLADRLNVALHVFRLPDEGDVTKDMKQGLVLVFRPADDFHVYGCEWDAEEIKWLLDGEVVHTEKNVYWHQPLAVHFDVETQVGWFGMPKNRADVVPKTFYVDWVRVWQKKGTPIVLEHWDDRPKAESKN